MPTKIVAEAGFATDQTHKLLNFHELLNSLEIRRFNSLETKSARYDNKYHILPLRDFLSNIGRLVTSLLEIKAAHRLLQRIRRALNAGFPNLPKVDVSILEGDDFEVVDGRVFGV
jgi:hypothetical protein